MTPSSAGPLLSWSPLALSYFAEMTLALVLTLALALRLVPGRGNRLDSSVLRLLAAMTACLTAALSLAVLHALAGGGWAAYATPWVPAGSWLTLAMPWNSVFGAAAATLFLQFAYRFPAELPGSARARRIATAACFVLIAIEAAVALRTDRALLHAEPWTRPDVLSHGMAGIVMATLVTFGRQWALAWPRGARWTALFGPSPSRAFACARAFFVFSAFPLLHLVLTLAQAHGFLRPALLDVLLSTLALVQLAGFALTWFSFMPENSSFLVKLTLLGMAAVLTVINAAGWALLPGLDEAHAALGLAGAPDSATRAIRFVPLAGGGYRLEPAAAPLQPDGAALSVGAAGRTVALPFAVPFAGRARRSLTVDDAGTVFFAPPPPPADRMIAYGSAPAVVPLLAPVEPGTRVTVGVARDAVLVTRDDGCPRAADSCLAVRTRIDADGTVTIGWTALPARPQFHIGDPAAGPWFAGLVPGREGGTPGPRAPLPTTLLPTVHRFDPHAVTTLEAGPGEPIVADWYLGFLRSMDRAYAPLAKLLLFSATLRLFIQPLILRRFLVAPLGALLAGMRRFRAGERDARVDVTFRDEIGYLTASFNAMADTIGGHVSDLEARVAERVAEVTTITAHSAKLEERARLCADLHDAVSQTLFSASLLAEGLPARIARDPAGSVEAGERIGDLARHALDELRLIMTELQSNRLSDEPLGHLLAELVAEASAGAPFGLATEIEAEIQAGPGGGIVLPAEIQAAFYRIAQESLANIRRHSGASHARLLFEAMPQQALLEIADDGHGFDPEALRPGHLGLQNMRYRAKRVNAALDISSRPGAGTTITLVWHSGKFRDES